MNTQDTLARPGLARNFRQNNLDRSKAAALAAFLFALAIGAVEPARACGDRLPALALEALSEDTNIAAQAIAALRARGPAGLEALRQTHAGILGQHSTNAANPAADPRWQRLRTALDQVSGQRDCHAAGLFWFTDFGEAVTLARASGKPILSLRLLGRLDEEFSCANSRFFRDTLYANEEVANYLRDHFVLHWHSVRPVPRVTIDFGDGRILQRTLTGNSIHYILDQAGRPVDALPGLYGPQAFLAGLARAEEAAKQVGGLSEEEWDSFLQNYHRERLGAVAENWRNDLQKLGMAAASEQAGVQARPVAANPQNAAAAARLAVGKRQVEKPLLRAAAPIQPWPESATDEALWGRIAMLHAGDARLDRGALALMRAKNPDAFDAGRRAVSKRIVEDPLLRAARQLERSIAEDTVRNEYSLHTRLHEWFASGTAPRDLDKLNARVYTELFLTPDSDPWLGLVTSDTYSALENDGVVRRAAR